MVVSALALTRRGFLFHENIQNTVSYVLSFVLFTDRIDNFPSFFYELIIWQRIVSYSRIENSDPLSDF